VSVNPDLFTCAEAAEYLRVSASRLRRGWGPKPLPQYRPRYMYSRRDLDNFLAAREMDEWDSSNAPAPDSGGSDSSTAGRSTRNQLERQMREKLAQSLRKGAPRSKPADPPTGGDGEGPA